MARGQLYKGKRLFKTDLVVGYFLLLLTEVLPSFASTFSGDNVADIV
ncbi:exported hypothetical protein [Vibrio nigripulchritudo SOn1]|uniref:Uncharacterized protein n=1 Tax=Vibrio nigripulchritudo SOn1 TaxID=1238450 RepID=A0AAV2VM96_9VIBR|nr:exported hypothetical protein [Vibrio nigripulchritudo SOn1]